MDWRARPVTPQPWHAGDGCIAAETDHDGRMPSIEDLGYYGGVMVCEGMSRADAIFAVTAIRQRDILMEAIQSILLTTGESPTAWTAQQALMRAALVEADIGIEDHILAVKVAVFREIQRESRYSDELMLPETASRARIEPTGFCYWPTGRFVYDNVELAWACRGNDRSPIILWYNTMTEDCPF